MRWDADQHELYEERVAIMVHDGGMEPAEAERQAKKIIEGRSEEPEQVELGLEMQGFRQAMRQLWRDY